MRLRTRILLGYVTVSLLIVALGLIILLTIRTVTPIVDEMDREVSGLSQAVSLAGLSSSILTLRKGLSRSAEKFRLTQDSACRSQYARDSKQLEAVFRQAIKNSEDEEDVTTFRNMREAARKLEQTERRMMGLIGENRIEEARQLSRSSTYVELNAAISNFITTFSNRKKADSRDVFSRLIDITKTTQAHRDRLDNLARVTALTVLLILVVSVAVGYLVSTSISRPLAVLTAGVEQVGKGDLDHRFSTSRADEIGMFARAFDRMTIDLKASTMEVRLAQRFSESIVSAVPSALVALDEVGRIVSANPAFASLFANEGRDHPIEAFLSDDNLLRAIEQAMFGRHSSLKIEADLPRCPGASLSITVTPLQLAEGASEMREQRARVLVVIDDVTQLRRLLAAAATTEAERKRSTELAEAYSKLGQTQKQLLRQEKLASVGQLAAGVAHEIRNRLSAISTCHDVIKSVLKLEEHPKLATMSNHIENEIRRGGKIVNDLLTFARPAEPEVRQNRVLDLIDSVLPLVSREMELDDIRVDIRCPEGLPMIQVDRSQIEQVLFNVLLNAQQAMTSALWDRPDKLIRIEARPLGEKVEIEISDNGPGIDPALLPRLFDPFFTTKEVGRGTGLGLSISYGIVERHGGQIEVHSRREKGARFIIRLPAVPA